MPTYVAPEGPSEFGAKQTRLNWSANTIEAANRVIATKGLLFYSGGGTGADLPVAGDLTKGITQLSAAPASLGSPIALAETDKRVIPTVSATIPSNPINGQLWLYRNASPAYTWMFRYNASSSSAYKWEFIGGAHASSHDTTSQTITLGTGYVGAPTSSAILYLPFTGTYMTGHEMSGTISAAGCQMVMSLGLGYTTETVSDDNSVIATTHTANAPVSLQRFDTITATTANIYIIGRWKRATATTGNVTVLRHALSAIPVRVG